MHPNKAPGLDGVNPFFHKHFWGIARDLVTKAVLDVLNGAPLPPSFNHTIVTLIPKKRIQCTFLSVGRLLMQRHLENSHQGDLY